MTIFDENQEPELDNQSTPPTNQNPEDALANQLNAILNDKGEVKYDSMDKALEALKNSQAYIPELKTSLEQKDKELAELKAKLDATNNVEEVVSKLLSANQPQEAAHPQVTSGLNEDGVAAIVNKALETKSQQDLAQANTDKVANSLMSQYGDKAKEVVAKKASDLGMSPQDIGALASKSPDAVLALFNTQQSNEATPTQSSTLNTSQFNQAKPADLKLPEKSLLSGATGKEQAAFMAQIKDHVYKKYDVQVA